MATRSHIGITELMNTLQKSGASFGNAAQMQQTAPFLQDNVRQQVYGQDKIVPQLKQKYHENLSRIAGMDQKLAGVYGDPNSSLFIENPVARERLKVGATETGYRQANDIKQQVNQRQSDLEQEVNDTLSEYSKLTTLQSREETRLNKINKQSTSVATKSQQTQQKAYQKQVEQLIKDKGLDITNKAKITDKKARDMFLSKPKGFQELWIRHMLDGGKIPKKGFTAKDIEDNYKQYEKTYKPTKKSTNERKPLF